MSFLALLITFYPLCTRSSTTFVVLLVVVAWLLCLPVVVVVVVFFHIYPLVWLMTCRPNGQPRTATCHLSCAPLSPCPTPSAHSPLCLSVVRLFSLWPDVNNEIIWFFSCLPWKINALSILDFFSPLLSRSAACAFSFYDYFLLASIFCFFHMVDSWFLLSFVKFFTLLLLLLRIVVVGFRCWLWGVRAARLCLVLVFTQGYCTETKSVCQLWRVQCGL